MATPSSATTSSSAMTASPPTSKEEALLSLEDGLTEEIDADFFDDPAHFRALHRVIDVLGAQLLDGDGNQGQQSGTMLANNPAYLALQRQKDIVEDAIEYMAVRHCADLNGSVAAVGRVARQFTDAVSRVQGLRRQVRELKDGLGSHAHAAMMAGGAPPSSAILSDANGGIGGGAAGRENRGQTLRELWLKKLECEAVLGLLDKLEVIRDAPTAFDALVRPADSSAGCRIGAAVVLLSNAISTMFSDDVAQVQALTRVMDQLMTRKQRAEEIVWDAAHDVVYLRTGNATSASYLGGGKKGGGGKGKKAGGAGGTLRDQARASVGGGPDDDDSSVGHSSYYHSDDNSSVSSAADGDSSAGGGSGGFGGGGRYGDEGGGRDSSSMGGSGGGGASSSSTGRMIPISVLRDDLDLEAEELRCLEDSSSASASPNALSAYYQHSPQAYLPRYTDATLALRILVEALARLGRLDDVERYLSESLRRELRRIAQLEQASTFERLERKRVRRLRNRTAGASAAGGESSQGGAGGAMMMGEEFKGEERALRHHLDALLEAFESVMLRLSHLAQVLRYRISSDPSIVTPSYEPKWSALHSVLVSADKFMQREIKDFMKACLTSQATPSPAAKDAKRNQLLGVGGRSDLGGAAGRDSTSRIFSLGIVTDQDAPGGGGGGARSKTFESSTALASRANVMDLSAQDFALTILFPRSGSAPNVRHALSFRRSLSRWTADAADLKRELAACTGEDTSSATYNVKDEETALEYLDRIIQKQLLPLLQEESVQNTIYALEREDAFLPVFKNNIYNPRLSEEDQPLCVACQALLDATGPLFLALHRLPQVGELYAPLVAVLEHAVLTFISRAKQRLRKLCGGKKADDLLGGDNNLKIHTGLSKAVEQRRAYGRFMRQYAGAHDEDHALDGVSAGDAAHAAGILPISAPAGDTRAKYGGRTGSGSSSPPPPLDSDQEREEDALQRELSSLHYLFRFADHNYGEELVACTDDELMYAASLGHSLLKLAGLLENRLRRGRNNSAKTRALREAIGTIRTHGQRVSKFCRIDVLVHTVKHMSKICRAFNLIATDAVRLPPCVNDLGEFLTNASDILRETGGNGITAYSLSSLEQYIPLLLMQAVRDIGKGEGRPRKSVISLKGIESLDRSGSVLYRDLKSATGFDGSFWDDAAATEAFERSASFVSLLELDMAELESYCQNNWGEFSDADYSLMFSMTCPRRTGDVTKYYNLKDKMTGDR